MKYSVLKTLQKACLSRLHLQLDTTPIQCTMYKCPGFPWRMHKNQVNYDICRSKNVKMCIDHNFQLGNGCFISFFERILITARLIIGSNGRMRWWSINKYHHHQLNFSNHYFTSGPFPKWCSGWENFRPSATRKLTLPAKKNSIKNYL